MPYITASDLQTRLGAKPYTDIFDDDNDGAVSGVDLAAVTQLITLAHVEVVSYLPDIWSTLPNETLPAPVLLWSAELDFAVSLSYLRHPEYARTFGNDPKNVPMWQRGEARMKRIVAGVQQVTDAAPAQGVPLTAQGGILQTFENRAFQDNPDGSTNSGDF